MENLHLFSTANVDLSLVENGAQQSTVSKLPGPGPDSLGSNPSSGIYTLNIFLVSIMSSALFGEGKEYHVLVVFSDNSLTPSVAQ